MAEEFFFGRSRVEARGSSEEVMVLWLEVSRSWFAEEQKSHAEAIHAFK